MPVRVRCPKPTCGKTSTCPDAAVGRTVRCPGCGEPFLAEAIGSASGSMPAAISVSVTSNPADTQETVGRFILVERLGSGAFGTVYKAHDPQLRRDVALKVPNPGIVSDPKRAERFLREAQAAAALRHPNIVPVYDTGRDGDRFFIASALIDGQPLADAIPENGMDAGRAAEIVRQLADAVASAHAQGIVHRDIKPANVLLDSADRPHLTDFGLAARAEDSGKLTNEGAVLGTPSYMAPEQAAGQYGEAKPAADQYALGVVLYELLTGRTPFQGPPAVALYHAIHSPPPPPRSVRPDVPEALEGIVLRAMAKDPAARFPDCRGLADALGRWLSARSAPPPPALWVETRPRSRAAVWVAVGGVGLLAVLVVGGIVAVGLLGRRPEPTAAAAPPTAAGNPDDPDDGPEPPPTQGGLVQWSGAGRWTKDGDELIGGVKANQVSRVLVGDSSWADYDFTVEFKVVLGYPPTAFVFRAVNQDSLCGVAIGPAGRAAFVTREPGAKGAKGAKVDKERPGKLAPQTWYTCRVSARKDVFQAELAEAGQSKPIVTLDHSTSRHPAGRVGITLGVPDSKASGAIRVRKLEVRAPDGKVLWSGLPDPP